ncbi:Hypothetical_protein [Hexamita inflata]|uniref:Hypothetical_protein n=1 Tax=Hexamita inflata TaxID=28002 RepID=A0AA86UHH8_9EUKA|nr:Hypothetical protein HINF_LOCUS46035 [Hexamita inflata]
MSSTDSTKEGILAYLLKSEKTIESIAFYNEEIAIRMLKQVTTIVISHAHFYYCHFSCVHGDTQGQTKNHYKNKCKRHVGFDSLSGAGYFDHRGRYSRIQYVLGQDEKLSSPPQMFIDRDHSYRIIRFYGEHDQGEYYCKEVQNLRHKFTAEEDRIILANVMKYSCLEGIELLFKDPEVQKQLTCTYCQLCRRAAYFAQRYISDDLLIAQLVQKMSSITNSIVNVKYLDSQNCRFVATQQQYMAIIKQLSQII